MSISRIIISDALKLAWRYKALWLLGILTGCNRSILGGVTEFLPPGYAQQLSTISPLSLSVDAIFVVLASFAGFALFKSAQRILSGESPSFPMAIDDAKYYFWRGLGLAIISIIFTSIINYIFTSLGALIGIGETSALLLSLPIGLAWGVFILTSQASLVVEDSGIGQALAKGWELFKANLGKLIGLSISLFFLALLGIVIVLLPLVLVFPLFALESIVVLILALLLYMVFIFAFLGYAYCVNMLSWTRAYMELTKHPDLVSA